MREKNIAIVLAAGRGKRMQSAVPKQYLLLQNKPVLYYSLKAFEECTFIDEIILVTQPEEIAYCREEIIKNYAFSKVTQILGGGTERYLSVYEGLKSIEDCTYVYIHDGARPFLDQGILDRVHRAVKEYHACVAAMPAKDTIKIAGRDLFAQETPERSRVWMVQTPQVFEYSLIKNAYQKLIERKISSVTDDAMVLEMMEDKNVKLVEGSYRNIKITTPEDIDIAEVYVKKIEKE